ncbi:MAG: hypothetical protein VSS75_032840, partial [Candidatus Parabeggiatoa sp.]|nr:hypothetical protein [Candidatus Parabeggiatoa sp.]
SLKEREIYPIKYHSIQGYYCRKIQDVKAIAARYNVKVYTSLNPADRQPNSVKSIIVTNNL